MKKFLVFIPVILIIAALLLGGCSTTPTTTSATPAATTGKTTTPAPTTVTPKTGGILRYGESLWYGALSAGPEIPAGWSRRHAFNVFFDTILTIDNKAGVHPALATAWNVATDLKSITLTLRQGVKFHDGSDWNAQVCKWNLDLLVTGKYGDYAYVSSVDVVDPYTVKLNLSQYSNSLLTTIGSTMVVSQKAYIDHGANKDAETWMRANAVGTGPFKLVKAVPNVSVEGTRFDGYWGGKPYLDASLCSRLATR